MVSDALASGGRDLPRPPILGLGAGALGLSAGSMRRAALWFLLPLFMLAAGVCWLVVTLDEPTAPDVARKAGL